MSGQEITIQGPDGAFMGYLARPSVSQGPGIVVIQEIFGVNHFVREITDSFAKAGYFALAPDLFWRIEPRINLTDKSEAEWKKAFDLFGKFDRKTGIEDIEAAIGALRNTPGCTGKVGTVGFCLGGLMAYLAATRTTTDASVGYYGVMIDAHLDEAKTIRKPLMLHIAGKDQFVDAAAQAKIKEGLGKHPLVTLHVYEAQDHAFARTGGQHYDKASAELAEKRTLELFKKALS